MLLNRRLVILFALLLTCGSRRGFAQEATSDVIVYIQSECGMSPRIFGRLAFMGAAGGRRYVHVSLSCALTEDEQIAALGHELRHAVEVADAPAVVDTASLGEEYQRIGYASHGVPPGSGFESRAAIDAAHQVWAELSRAEQQNEAGPRPALNWKNISRTR